MLFYLLGFDDLFLKFFLGRLGLLIRIGNDHIIIGQSNISITILFRLDLLSPLQSVQVFLLVFQHEFRTRDYILKPLLHIAIVEIIQLG